MICQDKPSLKDLITSLEEDEDFLEHYGTKRHSGRYPWGSGDNPYQHSGDFLSRVQELRKQNFSYTDPETGKTYKGDTAIAKYMGYETTEFRTLYSIAKDERRMDKIATIKSLQEDGLNTSEIGRKMGIPESTVRSLLNTDSEIRMNAAKTTADIIRQRIDETGKFIDVGKGAEKELGVSEEKLKQALYMLELEGYELYGAGQTQMTNPGKQTNFKLICPPGTQYSDIYDKNGGLSDNIDSMKNYVSHDNGETFDRKWVYPKSMNSNRLQIRYAEDGGIEKDGVIELRRGVDDLSLGNAHYAQVRILVDDNKYLKGMAVYSDNMPDGVDVIFNTNKTKDVPKMEVLKNIKKDPDNPFGALIKSGINEPDNDEFEGGQSYYYDSKGNKQLSLINKKSNEGDWQEWADKIPSQFLAKQSISLIKTQLDETLKDYKAEYKDICEINNPTIKKNQLESFANDCDAAAVHLKAAALPRQAYHVILPITSMKDTEIYAPNYIDGEKVALVRYPHAGTFEIPILTVNNKIKEAQKTIGNNSKDAVGINATVAARLSGADFDGDTVMVIPTGGKVNIKSTPALDGLKDFEPKMKYGTKKVGDNYYNASGSKIKVMSNTQTEMGVISNLITDMTLKKATSEELARAVRHSMVVIDAEKHKLDYQQSYKDNGIGALKAKYQGVTEEDGRYHEGAATLLSRAKSKIQVLKRVGTPKVDPETGEKTYKEVQEEYVDKNGKTQIRKIWSTRMAETKDAHELSSGTPQEEAYADYANRLKALANQARKEILATGNLEYSPSAAKTYTTEVTSLKSKLMIAEKNAPRERKAQILANTEVKAKKQSNPDMTNKELKKVKTQALNRARIAVGAKKEKINITDREWEAIQNGAVSENILKRILNNTDTDDLRQRATPRSYNSLSQAKINRVKSMSRSGYTNAQIADALGVSPSTVSKYIK